MMMRNLHLTISFILLSICAQAQLLSNDNSAPNVKKQVNETPDQARKSVISNCNSTIGAGIDEQFTADGSVSFEAYLTAMESMFSRRLKALETDDIRDSEQLQAKSGFIRTLNVLKSATCLSDKKAGTYVKQKDYDGQDIVAYPLDDLRKNVRYGFVEAYREGFARIKKDQVFGFINYCGDEVVPCQYETAEAFNNGRALVKKVDWFYIDAAGQESPALANVVDAKALTFGVSIAKFKDGKSALIDNRYDATKTPISNMYDEIVAFNGNDIFRIRKDGRYGLMNIQGVVKLEPAYDNIEQSSVSYLYKIIQSGKIGLMDNNWKVKFEPAFETIGDFDQNGLAVAKETDGYRLISNKTYKGSALYKSVGSFNNYRLAQVQNNSGNYGLINTDLVVVVEPQYFSINEFNSLGLAAACKYDKKCGYINTKGMEVITPIYESVGEFSKHGLVVVQDLTKDCNKNKFCKTDLVYNKNGQVIIAKPNEKEVSTMKISYTIIDSLHSDKYVAIRMKVDEENQGFHLVEANTFKLITSTAYNSITPLDVNGIMRIKKDELWGMMDTEGKIVLPPTYTEIRKTGEGFYAVKNNNDKFGFIDRKAKIQIPFEYEDVKAFKNGHCVVTRGKDKWGLINKFNAKVVPLYFKNVVLKDDEYEMSDDKGTIYVIDDKGDCKQNCTKFEEIRKKANQ
jgi:hypothetical protein